ncbi:MAG: carboxylating nicotinate-nucleotide diphosphorylase [Nitrospirae bacterium]|nr:carboxylating nicotinate-nucleotide diphosphorylase [Nitrospirota bacterium]
MQNDLSLIEIGKIVNNALSEDIGSGDITTAFLIPENMDAVGTIIAEEDIVLAGIRVAEEVFKTLDVEVIFEALAGDGESVKSGTNIARLHGKARTLLTGERVALNFLQRLSGIATLSRKYKEAVAGFPVRIVDTRKTTPGLRSLEKYAVRAGGCWNHRYGLFDGILIKENHIALTEGVAVAITSVKKKVPHTIKIEIEVSNIEEVREAVRGGADIILLDNMDLQMMREAVSIIREHKAKQILIEASGGMTLDRIRDVAATGVDIISAGALIHSAVWANLSMDVNKELS